MSYDRILELIPGRLQVIKTDDFAVRKFTNQLIMLSRLRNLQILTMKKVRNMGIKFDINQDILFLEGKEKAERFAMIEKMKGIVKMTSTGMSPEIIADYLLLDLKFVKEIQTHLLQKDKIITELKKKKATPQTVAEKLKINELLAEIFAEELKSKKNR